MNNAPWYEQTYSYDELVKALDVMLAQRAAAEAALPALRREFAAFLADIVASLEQISQDPDVTRGTLLALEGLALTIDAKRTELQDPS